MLSSQLAIPGIRYLFGQKANLTGKGQMWGGNRGERAYITVYMSLGEKSGKRIHFHILKKKPCHIWTHFTEHMKTAHKLIKPLYSHSRNFFSNNNINNN